MSGTGSIKNLTAWGAGLLIGFMGIDPAFALYNATSIDAISRVTISGKSETDSGLVTRFVVSSSTVSGQVYCGAANLPAYKAWHYTQIDLPREPGDNSRYRINDNLSLSATANNGSLGTWINEFAGVCSDSYGGDQNASEMVVAFPITLSFYVKKRPIDNLITFPQMPLGGYVRSFGGTSGAYDKIYAIPIVLVGGSIQLPSTCRVNPVALMLDHGVVSAGSTSHRTSSDITYTCDTPVKATLSLAYEADGNGELPLKDASGGTGAVSKLTITDLQTGASGRSIESSIETAKTFRVSSELTKITRSGALKGSAWLIALQD